MVEEAIKLYEPSNSTEGFAFESMFCCRCRKHPHNPDAKNQCGVYLRALGFRSTDPLYPKEWRYSDGKPVCTAFESREEYNRKRRSRKDNMTINLFT